MDSQVELAIFLGEFDRDGAGLGMTNDVGKSFLGDAEALVFDERFQSILHPLDPEGHLDAGQTGLALSETLQSRFQSQVIEQRGAQIEG